MEAGEHYLPHAEQGRREMLGTDPVTGKIREVIHLPSNSWLPLQSAFALAVVCVCLLMKSYIAAMLAALVAVCFLLRWGWVNGAHPNAAPVSEDESADPPLHSRSFDGPGLWGMGVALLANGTLYLSLLFGWFYLWTVAPLWAVPAAFPINWQLLVASGVALSMAVFIFTRAVARLKKGNASGLGARLLAGGGVGLAHVALLLWGVWDANLHPAETAHDSVLTVMLIYLLVHSFLAVIFTGLQAWRVKLGYVGSRLPYEPVVLRLFWLYTLGVFWVSFAAFILLPMGWRMV